MLGALEFIHFDFIADEKDFQCMECDKIFPTAYQLNQHSVAHSTERSFACTYCPAKFKRNGDLKRHSLRHTDETEFKNLNGKCKCSI